MDREYKSAIHRYVAAYIDLDNASIGEPDDESAACMVGRFYDAADALSQRKWEKCGSLEIPNLDGMLDGDGKASRLALSRIRAAAGRGCASAAQLEMEEAYSYAVFLERGKIKEEIPS